jgi:hypothetical protein
MRARFLLASVLAGASLAFSACARGDSIGSSVGGAGSAGGAGGASATGSTGSTTETTTTGSTGSGEHCGDVVGPDVAACCTACTKSSQPCQKNGCYGAYWCKPSTCGCGPPPTTCP